MADDYTSAYDIFQRPLGSGQARDPRLDRIGGGTMAPSGGMDYSSMMQDPMAWLSLLGTGLGVGSNLYAGQQQQQHYNQYVNQSKQPFNPMTYYQPATQLEQDAMTRALKGDLATRGVPMDSMATSGAVAELMGRDTLQRYQMALNPAMAQQQNILGALGSFKPAPAMGDISALPQYLSLMKMLGVRQGEQTNQQGQTNNYMAWLKSLFSNKEDQPSQLYQDINTQPASAGNFQGDQLSGGEQYSMNADPNAYAQ